MISIYTPTHIYNPKILVETYLSLKRQTFREFEWIILVNGNALNNFTDITTLFSDPWIKIYKSNLTDNIGSLKASCCELALGDILLELDHDDYLSDDALEEINKVYSNHPEVQFVYSNTIRFMDGTNVPATPFRKDCGWEFRKVGDMIETVAFPASAQYLRRIEWAPDHVRSFRKSAYKKINGYDKTLQVGDDHDIVCRFYIEFGENGFYRIDKPLYFYRVYSENTSSQGKRLNEIQRQVDINYIKHAEKMYLKWAKDNGLLSIDLGGRFNSPQGYKSVDLLDADIIMDLEKPWELADNSVGVIRAYHLLEHLTDTIHFFNEAYRVLAPGGFLLIEVPSVSGQGAFSDPTHVKFFNLRSFEYFTGGLSKFIRPQYNGKFQKARIVEYWWDKDVSVISAQLICLKGWYDKKWCGERNI